MEAEYVRKLEDLIKRDQDVFERLSLLEGKYNITRVKPTYLGIIYIILWTIVFIVFSNFCFAIILY
jgi:hypothetical protein